MVMSSNIINIHHQKFDVIIVIIQIELVWLI